LAIPRFVRLSGRIRLYPDPPTNSEFALDPAGRHRWGPIAPRAHVDVQMSSPDLRWRGIGYLDANRGSEPLERAFSTWTWSRTDVGDGAAILYDVVRRNADPLSLGLHFDRHGQCEPFAPPSPVALPRTRWRIQRRTRSESSVASVQRTLEDTPFYARSEVGAELLGSERRCMHECLSLDRFDRRLIQAMLPFRMPRVFR
jgi:carotenoid 1,2-hydratase